MKKQNYSTYFHSSYPKLKEIETKNEKVNHAWLIHWLCKTSPLYQNIFFLDKIFFWPWGIFSISKISSLQLPSMPSF